MAIEGIKEYDKMTKRQLGAIRAVSLLKKVEK